MITYCFSHDGEVFNRDPHYVINEYELQSDDIIYIAEIVDAKSMDYIDANDIIQSIRSRAIEHSGVNNIEWLSDVSSVDKSSIEYAVQQILIKYRPDFYYTRRHVSMTVHDAIVGGLIN